MYYYTNNISFSYTAGNYYVYIFNETQGQEIFINDPELINSCPIGLAIDNFGFFYVALQCLYKRVRGSQYSFCNYTVLYCCMCYFRLHFLHLLFYYCASITTL